MAKEKVIEYRGQRATVSWSKQLCIHIGECGRAEGELFTAGRDPWCDPDVTSNDAVRDVVLRCPTGALTVEFADGHGAEVADAENTVQVAYNGPLFVRGDLNIDEAPQSDNALQFRAALCRCGQSGNKPFCDNAHEKAGFQDYGAVGEAGDPTSDAGGALSVKPIKDGPLVLSGNFSIVGSSGRKAWSGTKAFLCRCGASANKPFCDGAHKAAGFRSEPE